VDLAGAVVHAGQFAAAVADELHDAAHVLFGHINHEILDWLEDLAVGGFAGDDVRLADRKLVAFAAHVFDEDAQVEQSAAGDFEGVFVAGFFDAQGDVGFEFLEEALADVSAGDVFAIAAGEGGVVDAEHHGERGGLDFLGFEGDGNDGIADGVADFDGLEAYERDDIAGGG
jgi:hypothetical protein